MAVNKNFVVKNGLEVAVDAITVDASSKRVGLGTTNPNDTLDVRGGIEATTIEVQDTVHVGTSGSVFYASNTTSNVGIGTSVPQYTLEVKGPVSTGATALYVYGDARVTGDLFLDDITIDNATVQNLTVLDFKSTSGNNITDLTIGSGIATVTIAPGVSLGLAIALGG